MYTTIKTFETHNNTYRIIKTAKTTYEQQQEKKEKVLNIIKHVLLSIALLAAGIKASNITGDGMAFIATLAVGILYLIYKLGGYGNEYNL